ncbi:MAG TPA: flagellar motor switch protein FliN [Nitrospirota bacterium]|jgi:flagellar motor switch protein FliN/FliY
MSDISDKDRAAAEAMEEMLAGQTSANDEAAAEAMQEMLAGQTQNISDKDQAAAEAMEQMMLQQAAPEDVAQKPPAPPVKAQPVSFAEVRDSSTGMGTAQNLEFIMDIPLRISVELGRTKVMVGDLLRMAHGSVIELDKMAGEPMEVMVNDKLIAKGEVVLVNEKLGIRLTDIVSQTERIKKLG